MKVDSVRNLTQQVVESVGVRIVKGEVKEGEIITTGALQEQYGVSRTVVREALQILQSKGLIQSRTKTGTSILGKRSWNLLDPEVIAWYRNAGAGVEMVNNLEEIRESYEPWAARLAARRRNEEDLLVLRHAYEAMASATTVEGPDSPAVIDADLEFHQAILEATHNDIMIRLGLLVQPVLQIRNEMALYHDTTTDFIEDHRIVLEAIENEQPGWAEEAMRDLLDRSTQDTAKLRRGKFT